MKSSKRGNTTMIFISCKLLFNCNCNLNPFPCTQKIFIVFYEITSRMPGWAKYMYIMSYYGIHKNINFIGDPLETEISDRKPNGGQLAWSIGDRHASPETDLPYQSCSMGLRWVPIRHVGFRSGISVSDQACWSSIRHVGHQWFSDDNKIFLNLWPRKSRPWLWNR